MDLGRNGAGPLRVKYAIDELEKVGKNFSFPSGTDAQQLEQKNQTFEQLKNLAANLEEYGVFYSFPLDLDMAMIRAYPGYYDASNAQDSEREALDKAVLGEKHEANDYDENGCEVYSDEELKKYRYLFCTKSKVASHYKAMADILELDEIETDCPDFIKRLIEKCSVLLRGTEDK